MEDDGSRCGEILGSAMMLGNKCRGSGTGTVCLFLYRLKTPQMYIVT